MEFASDITRVPFGRTGALIGANDAPSPEVSYGHDLKSIPLHGVSKIRTFLSYRNSDRKVRKTMVGSGRTEVSIPPFSIFSRATRWAWFQGHKVQ